MESCHIRLFRLLQLSITFAWVIQVAACVSTSRSSLWPDNTPSHSCTTFYLSICQLMHVWVVAIVWLLEIPLLRTSVYKFVCGRMFSVLLSMYLRVELPNHSFLKHKLLSGFIFWCDLWICFLTRICIHRLFS